MPVVTANEAGHLRATAGDVPYDLTIDLFSRMVESGLIPCDRRVFLLEGKLGGHEGDIPILVRNLGALAGTKGTGGHEGARRGHPYSCP